MISFVNKILSSKNFLELFIKKLDKNKTMKLKRKPRSYVFTRCSYDEN